MVQRKGRGRIRTGNVWLSDIRHDDDPDDTDYDHAVCVREQFGAIKTLYEVLTYKPASVKMDVKTTCCLSVTRRRHRSGIGYFHTSAIHVTYVRVARIR